MQSIACDPKSVVSPESAPLADRLAPHDPDLEAELRELVAEYAPKTVRERLLVRTIVMAERELAKLDRVSRLSAAPCDSTAFTRAFSSARNGRDQADRALDRLRAAAAGMPAKAAARSRKATKAEDDETAAAPDSGPYNPFGEEVIRDTGYMVQDVAILMMDGWSDEKILAEFTDLRADDLEICRADIPKNPHRFADAWFAAQRTCRALTLWIALAVALVLAATAGRRAAAAAARAEGAPFEFGGDRR